MIRKLGSQIRNQWIGTLALFLVLGGGTAFAASGAIDGPLPGVDQVGSLDIIDGQVLNADIGKKQVNSGTVKDDSLTGDDINESSLIGQVDNCPVGMTMFAQSFCLDASARTTTDWFSAMHTCAANGLRLPTVGELGYADYYNQFPNNIVVWTDQLPSSGGDVAMQLWTVFTPHLFFASDIDSTGGSVYCAASSSDLF
jgi:hypothetical protein